MTEDDREGRRQLQRELIERREQVFAPIIRKNRLHLNLTRLRQKLEEADEPAMRAIEAQLPELEQEYAAAIAEVERLKDDMREFEASVRERVWEITLRDYPPENRARAKELLQLRAKTLFLCQSNLAPNRAGRALNRQMANLLADIREAREAGDDPRADALVVQLDEVIREIEIQGPVLKQQAEEEQRKVTAKLDEELEALKQPGS
jgi:hypothetical protein